MTWFFLGVVIGTAFTLTGVMAVVLRPRWIKFSLLRPCPVCRRRVETLAVLSGYAVMCEACLEKARL